MNDNFKTVAPFTVEPVTTPVAPEMDPQKDAEKKVETPAQ